MDARETLALLSLIKDDFHDFDHVQITSDYIYVFTREAVNAAFSPIPIKNKCFVLAGTRTEDNQYRIYQFDLLCRKLK